MTPSDYAAEELAMWERALAEQRKVERELAAARRARTVAQHYALLRKQQELRTRADLLLVEAVKKKLSLSRK